MSDLFRNIALYFRQRSERREEQEVLRRFSEWETQLENLPQVLEQEKKIALVRLDDIGDYLLFRNFLNAYKDQHEGYAFTLVGNIAWKSIFDAYDADAAISAVWVDKHRYFTDESYRDHLWLQLRNGKFETVICPSRTRPLLLDDCMAIATGAAKKMAAANSFHSAQWNAVSDQCYDELFKGDDSQHEFAFNKAFAEWATGMVLTQQELSLPKSAAALPGSPDQVLCFIGASARSKTWPLRYWIDLVRRLQQHGYAPLLSGGKNEVPLAEQIVSATQVASITGQTNLIATLEAIDASIAVITGDTMAAHAAVAAHIPTLILANGVNAHRFVAYEENGYKKVKTLYTRAYHEYATKDKQPFRAVTKDMESILPGTVFEAFRQLSG